MVRTRPTAFLRLGTLCLLAISANTCFAQGVVSRPSYAGCPDVAPNGNWRDYFLSGNNQRFQIYFDAMKGKSDAGWGTLAAGLCLRGYYRGNGRWYVYGHERNGTTQQGFYSADPNNEQINIWGHIFTFNGESGEIKDAEQGVVGHLHCAQVCY